MLRNTLYRFLQLKKIPPPPKKTLHRQTKAITEWSDHLQNSVQFSRSVVSNSLRPHELQHSRPPCPSPASGACSDSCSSSQWCHQTISSSVIPFSCLQSFPASGSFPVSQFFTSGGQSIGVSASASVLPMNIQDWFPLGLTDLVSLQSVGLSRKTTVKKKKKKLLRWRSHHKMKWPLTKLVLTHTLFLFNTNACLYRQSSYQRL